MGDAGDFTHKVLIKATRVNNSQAGTPAVVCDQEAFSSREDLRSRVEIATARAISADARKHGSTRVRAMVLVTRRADGKKEGLKQFCTVEELPAIAASLASDCATALAGDPLAPSPGSLISGAKDFARDAHQQIREAAAWIAPLAKTPGAPAAAPGVAQAAAPAVAEAVQTARKVTRAARAARAAGAAPPTPEGMLQNILTGVFKNIMKNPETIKSVMETGQKIAASLPPPPIKPV